MKKKILAILSAVMIIAMNTMTVAAASPTVGTTEVPDATQTTVTAVEATASPAEYAAATVVSAGFKVDAASQQTVEAAKVAVQNNLLNHVAAIGNALGDSNLAAAATNASVKVTAKVLSVVEVNTTSAVKDAAGNYAVTLGVAGIAAGDTIAVLHYNGSAWETIKPSAIVDGYIAFSVSSLSPIAVVKLDVTPVSTAPQTGEAVPYAVWIIAAGFAGAVLCGKKVFA